ncbi:MAG: alkaline phosphatase family protein [Gemmatimonadota bacterium]
MMRNLSLLLLSALLLGRQSDLDAPPSGDGTPGGGPAHQAILVSIDALSESILRRTLPREVAPTLHRIFQDGACAEYAISHYPSVTAAAHATLWTGAYGNVTGVTTNTVPLLPRSQHTILESHRGFSYEALRAEALWITAGREGVSVAGHHVTQAPGLPGYLPLDSVRTPRDVAARREAGEILALPHVRVMNGYNRSYGTHRVVTAASASLHKPQDWRGLDGLSLDPAPRAFAWHAGPDSIFGLLVGSNGTFDRAILSRNKDAATGVEAWATPPEDAPIRGRPLARHFSDPLRLEVEGDILHLWFRLFHVEPDGEDFVLYHPSIDAVELNRPDLAEAYHAQVQGWFGNGAHNLYRRGGFGPTLWQGGDGTAESRYLETAELLTRQFNRGSAWLWETGEPRLLLDYFPLGDDIDHTLLGFLEPARPGYDPELAGALARVRERVWELVDLRVGFLESLVIPTGGALFVSGDHGMRPSWRIFRPNRALEEAGLLVRGADGAVDLSRTVAYSNGYFVMLNRTAWRGGIVESHDEARVVERVRAALMDARDSQGVPVVTGTYVPEDFPELGMGGPTGGDVYWSLAPFTRPSWELTGPVLGEAAVDAGHGFLPTEPDMFTVFCAVATTLAPRRIGPVHLTAVAPTVAEWVGVSAPGDAVGESVLGRLRSPD